MKKRNMHPEWAFRHDKPVTELRFMKGRYYLYEVSSKWNKAMIRVQKITCKILGLITEKKFGSTVNGIKQKLQTKPKCYLIYLVMLLRTSWRF